MRTDRPPRIVTLVLCNLAGEVVGALPPFTADLPYWQEAGDVVRRARELYGLDVVVLRLLDAELGQPHGGKVSYLAETTRPSVRASDVNEWSGRLADDPLRLPYARPGGPAAAVAWATAELTSRGRAVRAAPEQMRTWNLSSLWRIPTDTDDVWLKLVPPFFAHEGDVLELFAAEAVPPLVAHDGPRMLLEQVDGNDLHSPTSTQLTRLLDLLVDLQSRWSGRIDQLAATGMADFRADSLTAAITSVVERTAPQLDSADNTALEAFVAGLPGRFAALAGCGVPDTIVHGDFHPGNARGTGTALTVLDWGDCGVGHPLLDEPAFLDRVPSNRRRSLRTSWHRRWREAVPGCDPERAAALLEPVAAARQATIYQLFLDNIEASERPYHRDDPRHWLQRTARLVSAGSTTTR